METDKYDFEFDIYKQEVITDCNLYPTEVSKSDTPWLHALNNKYRDEDVNPKKVGKWMLFLSKDRVNEVWDKIKKAIANGDLWHSKVSTKNPEPKHAIMIYTKDYTDLDDVIHVLNYLESSGIKAPHVTIKYKTDEQTRAGIYRGGRQKPWIYTSDTIRGTTSTQCNYSLSWRNSQPVNESSSSASALPRPNDSR